MKTMKTILATFAASFAVSVAYATEFWWSGASGDDKWTTESNWKGSDGESYPQSTDDWVRFSSNDMSAAADINLDGLDLTVRDFIVGAGSHVVTFRNGALTTGSLYVGNGGMSTGSLYLKSGTWKVQSGIATAWPDNIIIGWQREGLLEIDGAAFTTELWTGVGDSGAKGTISVKSGSFTSTGEVQIGNGGLGVLDISGGEFTANSVPVGGGHSGSFVMSGGEFKGELVIGGWHNGTMEMTGGVIDTVNASDDKKNFVIGRDAGVTGMVHIVSGTITNYWATILGGRGTAVMNMDGGVLVVNDGGNSWDGAFILNAWTKDDWNGENVAEGTTLNFNGGTIVAKRITALYGINPVMNWNGGTLKLPEERAWDNILHTENGTSFTVNVLSGGAIVDTSVSSANAGLHIPLSGVGMLVKKGEGKLWNSSEDGALDCRGGYRVDAGTLELNGLSYGTTAVTPVGEVYVEEGATLDLSWKDIYTFKYTNNGGTVKNGNVIVVDDTTPVLATWTGDESDDVTCPGNWDVRTASGLRIYGALPTAGVKTVFPYSGELIDTTEVLGDVVWRFSSDAKLHGGADAPEIAKSAIAWYDAADESAVTVDGGGVSKIANKGSAGTALDLKALDSDRPGYDGSVWSQNDNSVFAFTNSHGFASASTSTISGKADRTMIVLSKYNFGDDYPYIDDKGDTQYTRQIFPMALEYGSNGAGSFFIKSYSWNNGAIGYSVSYYDETEEKNKEVEKWSPSRANDWNIATMISDNGTVKALDYSRNNDATSTIAEFDSPSPEETDKALVVVGHYRPWWSTSTGLWAEGFVFDKALTDDELATMRTYLKAKWFGDLGDVVLPTAIELENGATVDMNSAALKLESLSGSGTLANFESLDVAAIFATADGVLAIEGDFDFTDSTITPDDTFAIGDVYTITVTGTIKGTPKLLLPEGDSRLFKVRNNGTSITVTRVRRGLKIVIQ